MNTFCSYFNSSQCKSCTLIDQSYQEQLVLKEQILKEALEEFSPYDLLPTVPSLTEGFRNKAKILVTGTVDSPVLGLYGTEELDQGREIINCPVHHPEINKILSTLPAFIRLASLHPYKVSDRTGELKGVIIFYSESSGESYLRFVLRSKEGLDRIKKFLPELLQNNPGLKCVSANIQPIPHALLEGPEEIILTTEKKVRVQGNGFSISYHPQGFVQTNQGVAMELYQTASRWIEGLNIEKFCELFSGQGAFSFHAAPYIKSGLGIELNSEAVQEANRTASEAKFQHLQFKVSDSADIESALNNYSADLLLVNPPRKGLGRSLPMIKRSGIHHLIYSSCSHKTLAADLKSLSVEYKLTKVQIFDMFPHTSHFETLTYLTRR